MRKVAARSIAVALVAVLISGCSSTGGKKSFSWSSMNPMTYFAKSDSDSPVPKPSEQMAPTVTLRSAADVTSSTSGELAPPSPYGKTSLGASGYQSPAGQVSSATMAPQTSQYDLNGYAGESQPYSGHNSYSAQGPAAYSGYNAQSSGGSDYQLPGGGYQMPSNSGYDASSSAQYALRGGNYDIQSQNQNTSMALPEYANPTSPYGSNAAPYAGSTSSPYQTPPFSSQGGGGYDTGFVQDPYGYASPDASMNRTGTQSNAAGSYAGSSFANPADSGSLGSVASLPQNPPLPGQYTNSRPAYEPGNTGYNPPNVPAYTPPTTGGYVQPAMATESDYAPGSVSRYPSTSSQSSPIGGAGQSAYGSTGSLY